MRLFAAILIVSVLCGCASVEMASETATGGRIVIIGPYNGLAEHKALNLMRKKCPRGYKVNVTGEVPSEQPSGGNDRYREFVCN